MKKTGLVAGSLMLGGPLYRCIAGGSRQERAGRGLVLRFRPFVLQHRHEFTIASGSRTTTPVMLTELGYEGITGYGEASMPPYLGESHDTAGRFLERLDLSQFSNPFRTEEILDYVESIAPGNHAAKASVDIALHDLTGKLLGQPWYKIWGFDPGNAPDTSYTIGIDTPEVVREKTREASPYKILKVKLGLDTDRQMIEAIRSVTSVPLCVDVNQGWKDREEALEMIHWLKEQGVVFVEQPMPVEAIDDMAWLTERSPLPTIADEAVQGPADVGSVYGAYHGINIKLMKCGGMRAAHQMASAARVLGMRLMLGCMIETSCAISAASHLSPVTEWADLDGNLLITNDPFEGMKIIDGRITPPPGPGIGVTPA